MMMQCVRLFNLDFLSAVMGRYNADGQSIGICLWPGMTSMDKLLLGFLTSMVVLIELLILRMLPLLYGYHSRKQRRREMERIESQTESDDFSGDSRSGAEQPLMEIKTQGNDIRPRDVSMVTSAWENDVDNDDDEADTHRERLSIDKGSSYKSKQSQQSKQGVDINGIKIGSNARNAFKSLLLSDVDRDVDIDESSRSVGSSNTRNSNKIKRKKKTSTSGYDIRKESWSYTRPNSVADYDEYEININGQAWDGNYNQRTESNCIEKIFWCLCCMGCDSKVCQYYQAWNLKRIFDKLNNNIVEYFSDTFWNAILIIYMPIAEATIKMFNCSQIKDNSLNDAIDVDITNGKYYLWYAGEYECYNWWQIPFMILFVAILLFPFYIVVRLWTLKQDTMEYWNKKTGLKSIRTIELNPDKVAHKRHRLYSAFSSSYTNNCWWYESIMIGRRIVLISVYAFPKSDLLLLKCMLTFICGIIFGIHINYKPFKHKVNNYLESLLLVILFFISSLSTAATYQTYSNQDIGDIIETLILICSILPLFPLPFLIWRYWKSNVKPKIEHFSEKRRLRSMRSNRSSNNYNYAGGDSNIVLNDRNDVDDDVDHGTGYSRMSQSGNWADEEDNKL